MTPPNVFIAPPLRNEAGYDPDVLKTNFRRTFVTNKKLMTKFADKKPKFHGRSEMICKTVDFYVSFFNMP